MITKSPWVEQGGTDEAETEVDDVDAAGAVVVGADVVAADAPNENVGFADVCLVAVSLKTFTNVIKFAHSIDYKGIK